MSSDVQAIVALGRMPSDEDEPDEGGIWRWQRALDALDAPLTAEEAVPLLECFPPDGSTTFGLAWTLLHAIESAPYNAGFVEQLDDRSPWVRLLRDRAIRGGLIEHR